MKHAYSNEHAAEITQRVLARILEKHQPRDFAMRLWDGAVIPADGSPRFTLVLNRPGALRRMFLPPTELAIGEAFLRGDFDFEGDIFAAFSLRDAFSHFRLSLGEVIALVRDLLSLPNPPFEPLTHPAAKMRGSLHSRARDRAAISYHYDVGNEFYALWLDRRMIYSCAYFPAGTEDLDTAQEKKLEHICRKLRLREGERLLDIGCGWGGLVIYAAEKYGVQALGVTLSRNQAALANQIIAERDLETRVRVELLDYRDLNPGTAFDKISSIGMFEHVGRSHLTEYFAHLSRLLRSGGLLLNHGISLGQLANQRRTLSQKIGERLFSFGERYVFPDGELESVNDVNAFAERAGFEIRDVESFREHYGRTLRHWVARLESRREDAIRLAGETTYRVWRLYMAGSAFHFDKGDFNVYQTLLSKSPSDGTSRVPLSRADLYT